MDLIAYENLIRSESTARKYLLGFCLKNQQRICPDCRSRILYRLADKRRRCSRCKRTFHDFSDRWLNIGYLDCRQWLRVIKLFELEISTRKIAVQTGMAYNTAHKATMTIRAAILAHAQDADRILSGEVELDESYFGGRQKGKRGRGAAHKIPVFGILEREGQVTVEVVPNVQGDTLCSLTVKKVRRGSVIYTDKFQAYNALMCCGYRHLKVDHSSKFVVGKVYINGLEGFWSFAKERLAKHHGVSPRLFPFYLKEMEFRYNHRYTDIFPILCSYLADFVPNLE
jgi:transposase